MNSPTGPLILVVGATGALGRPVVKLLRAVGVAVRALNRHPDQATDLAALGAEVVKGDLIDPGSLRRACVGVTGVLACAHSILGRGRWRSEAVDDTGHRSLIDAARAARVGRFVYVSGHGVRADHPVDFFRTKHCIEQVLAGSGLGHVILRPTAFMEHHVHNFVGKSVLEKGKVQFIGPASKPRNFIAATDIAPFAVKALLDDPLPFRSLTIGGHGHMSNLDVARLYARLAGVEFEASHMPVAAARVVATLAAPVHPGMARIMRMFGLPDDAFDEHYHGAAEFEAAHGVRLKRTEEFIAEQVALAKSQSTSTLR